MVLPIDVRKWLRDRLSMGRTTLVEGKFRRGVEFFGVRAVRRAWGWLRKRLTVDSRQLKVERERERKERRDGVLPGRPEQKRRLEVGATKPVQG